MDELEMKKGIACDKMFKVMFIIMFAVIIILAVQPRKVIVLGSANDHQGDINLDVQTKHNGKVNLKKVEEEKE